MNVNPSTPGAPDLAAGSDSGASSTDNITNAASLGFSGTGAAGDNSSTVRVFIDKNGNGSFDAGTDSSATATMSGGAWTVSGLSTAGYTDGSYSVYALATSATGSLSSAASIPLALTLDRAGPTLAITSNLSTLKAGQVATITFTFSEDPGASFGAGDIAVAGGTLGALSGSGTTRTATFTPTPGVDGGSATITVNSGAYSDTAGNNGSAGASPSLSFDTLAPNAPSTPVLAAGSDTGLSSSDGLTADTTPTLSGTAEAGATVRLYDTDGVTMIGSGTATGGVWSITTGALSQGTHTVTAKATDAAGNDSPASAPLAFTIDATAPTLSITSDKAALKAGETATVTFTFTEDPGASFDAGDIVVGGATLGALSGSGTVRTASFTPAAGVNATTGTITVASGAWTDAAGNAGGAGATPALAIDTLAPTLAIGSSVSSLKAGQTATITFTFSEDPGASFTAADIVVSGGTLGALSGTGTTRTAVFTPTAGVDGGTASITVAAGTYADAAGNDGQPGATPALVFDTLAPATPSAPLMSVLDDTGFSASDNLTRIATPTFSGTADDGATVTLYDGAAQVGSTTASGGTWSIVSSTLGAGNHSITAVARDAAGNASAASAALALSVDTSAPTLAITSDKASLMAGETAAITFTFSEDPGSTFAWDGTSGSVAVSGGTLGAVSGSGTVRTAVFTPLADADGSTASITVAGGAYTDAAGNAGTAGASPSLGFDTQAPTVAITSDVATLRAGQGATITFTFSEDPGASFVHGDVVVTGGTLGALAGSGTTRTALFTPVPDANAGVASITIGAGTYADAAGNGGAAGATPALVFDTLAPNAPSAPHLSGLDDSGVSGSDNVTNAASLTFSGTAEDGATVRLYDGAAAIGSVVASGGTWSIAVAGMAEGPHAISAGATDAAGNASALSGATAVVVDRTAPTLAISSDASALKTGETATITFTFSQDPGSTFGWDGSSGDVAVTGGTLGPVSGTGNVRTAVFTPAAGTNAGSATIEVGGSWSDAAGNAGAAASSPALVFDTQAPTLAITSSAPALKVGETAVITFTFSEDPGASFDTADITVTGGTLGALAGSGAVRTALFTPTPGTNGGSATISVTAAGWQDVGGNAGPGASVPALVFDTLAPAAPSTPDLAAASDKGVSNSDNLTSTATPTITGSAENGVTVTLYDGASVVGSAVASGGNWSIVTSPLGAGAHALTAVAADAAGNVGAASGTLSVSVDRAAPTLSIAIDEAALMAGTPALVTFTFSEDPGASFSWNGTSGDITVAGGKLGALGGGGAVRTALFTPDAAGEGAATITVAAGSYADAAGNAGAGGSVSVSFDNRAPDAPSAPLLAAGSDSGASDSDGLTNASSLSFEGSAEDGVTVALVDAATGAVLGTAVASGGAWSIAVGRTAEGPLKVAAIATDDAGNTSPMSGATTVTIDRTAPAAPALALVADTGLAGDGITSRGLVQASGIASGATWEYSVDGGASWSTGSGSGFALARDGAYDVLARQSDAAGNAGAASATLHLALDTTAPTSTVTLDHASVAAGGTALATITFSEAVRNFDLADITADNATMSGLATLDGGRTWTALLTTASGVASAGNTVRVANGGVTDVAGNAGTGSSQSVYSAFINGLSATITLSDFALAAGETAQVTIRFTEPVTGFAANDLQVANGSLSRLASSDGGQTWTAILTPSTGVADATNVIVLDNGGVAGTHGSHGSGTSMSANYTVSTVRPQATVTVADHLIEAGSKTTVSIGFSEAVAGFDLSDLSASNGVLSELASRDGGMTWSATLTAPTTAHAEPGRVALDMGGLRNAAGNAGNGYVYSSQYVVGTGHSHLATVDGVPTMTDEGTDPGTGLPTQSLLVTETTNTRIDDPGSPNSTLADIPLGVAGAANSLTASLPQGAGLQVEGPAVLLDKGQGMADLIARIEGKTASGSATQADMTGHVAAFLDTLASDTRIETRTITPSIAPGTPSVQPIMISGALPQPGAPVVCLVIDGSSLPAGSTLLLDNVEFAAIIGDLRVIGGAGRNYVVGDGGAQTIYLGADDDVLAGGAGNDFIGSAGGDDHLDGGDGIDLVAGGIGNDTLLGGAGDDMLQGGRSTTGSWDFHVSAGGTIAARHGGAVFTLDGAEQVRADDLDAAVPELAFLHANAEQLVGISLLYGALGRAPDLAGLSYWSQAGISLHDVATGVLDSAEWNGGALSTAGDEAFVRGMYATVLGREPDAAGLAYWLARLAGSDGTPAGERVDVLVDVALGAEHRGQALGADGYVVGQASLAQERAWYAGSGDDRLEGGAGNDLLVGGDGVDTAVYEGNQAGYRVLLGTDGMGRVAEVASGDVDTLSSIESAAFADGALDLAFLRAAPARLEAVGLLYQAVLDRPGDVAGLNWWLDTGYDAASLARAFTGTVEFRAHFDGMGDAAFVEALYDNSGLDATAAGGMQAWQGYLANHTRAELVAQWIAQDSVAQAQFGTAGLWLV